MPVFRHPALPSPPATRGHRSRLLNRCAAGRPPGQAIDAWRSMRLRRVHAQRSGRTGTIGGAPRRADPIRRQPRSAVTLLWFPSRRRPAVHRPCLRTGRMARLFAPRARLFAPLATIFAPRAEQKAPTLLLFCSIAELRASRATLFAPRCGQKAPRARLDSRSGEAISLRRRAKSRVADAFLLNGRARSLVREAFCSGCKAQKPREPP